MTFDELSVKTREGCRFTTLLNRVRERMVGDTAQACNWRRERVLTLVCEASGWSVERGMADPVGACRVYLETAPGVRGQVVRRNLITPFDKGALRIDRAMLEVAERVNGMPRPISMSSRVRPSYKG